MAFISVTRLRLKRSRYLPRFLWYTFRSYLQARTTKGNIALQLLKDADNAYWTRSAWESESAMRGFMLSGAHKQVMPYLLDWCDEGHVAHWVQESAELPSWSDAYRRLIAEGRASKVRNPSPRHHAMSFPPPRI